MPEGPEARRMAECLLKSTLGHKLISIDKDEKSKYSPKPPKDATTTVATAAKVETFRIIKNLDRVTFPLSVADVFSRGKKVIFHLKRPDHSFQEQLEQDVYLIFSLGMEGKFVRDKRKHSNLWLTFEKQTIYFDDVRHFGGLKITIGFQEFANEMKDLGPDLLNDNISKELWLSILRNPKIQGKQICEILMDQSKISSIGNYLKAEILYRCKIRPDRKLKDLSDEECIRLLEVGKATINEAYTFHGNTIKTYWDLEGQKGLFVCLAYDKKVDPLGNPIITTTFADKRTTHWCPAVQV